MKSILSLAQIKSLRALKGQRLAYVAGPNLTSEFSSDFVIIATDAQSIGLEGDIHFEVFEGFPEVYSSIETRKTVQNDVAESKAAGNQYFCKQGELISEISIVRDSLEGSTAGLLPWHYETDIGISLKLESGSLVISRLGYHDETLQVTYLDQMNLKDVPPTLGRFDSDPHSTFTSTRSIFTI